MNWIVKNFDKIYSYSIGSILLLQAIIHKATPIGFALLALITIVGYSKKLIQFKLNWALVPLIALYTIYAIAIIPSPNPEAAKTLEYKLSLLLLPTLFFVKYQFNFTIKPIFNSLIVGCIIGSIMGLMAGISCYLDTHIIHCILSTFVSPNIHPTYFSAFIAIAITMLWVGYKKGWKEYSFRNVFILSIYFITYSLLLMSLAGMLFIGFMIILLMGSYFYKKWHRTGLIALLVAAPLFIISSYKFIPQVKDEVDDIKYYLKAYLENENHYFESLNYPYSGTQTRLIMWRLSAVQMLENPLGAGTGAFDQVMEPKMREKGLHEDFIAEHYNPHNQYMQTTIELGIFGLITLLIIILIGFIKAYQKRNLLLFMVTANFAFNCLFESMLQRDTGIVFFTLLFCLLLTPKASKLSHE